MNQFNKLDKFFITLAIIFGGLIIVAPVHYLLLAFLSLIIIIFLLAKPLYCYSLLIFTIPFTERLRNFPISFSLNDVLVALCTLAVIIKIFLKAERINLKTSIDKWVFVLLILYFSAGLTSEGDTGLLSSFKFLEAIVTFYLTVYFIRTKEVNISQIIKLIFITAVFQALIGTFQSITGLGATFRSPRGFWGYFGLGSNMVWHGMGTMGHFNMLGNFLTTTLLFSIPVNYYLIKNKRIGKIIIYILLLGVITTYSRGSLLGLFFGYLYFLFGTMKNKFKFSAILIISLLIIYFLKNYLGETSYVETLSSRDDIWRSVIASILSNPKYLWLGAGLNSYEQVVWAYLPQNNVMWYAHNFYLLCAQEMGIIGAGIVFSFLIFILIDTWKRFKSSTRLLKALNLSVSLCILSIFFVSIYDHAYSLTFFKILLFLMLGIVYAKDKRISRQ